MSSPGSPPPPPPPHGERLPPPLDRRLSVAPMMDCTDRHCRSFHRVLTRKTLLYTEMGTTGALLHGDWRRFLAHEPAERPLALQLGGDVLGRRGGGDRDGAST